jgi:hypothetical protein
MNSVAIRLVCCSSCAVLLSVAIGAQQGPANPHDPRVGLKAGLRDAGEAAWNMTRISSVPKPEGFFDPRNPAGPPIPPEPPDAPGGDPAAAGASPAAGADVPPVGATPPGPGANVAVQDGSEPPHPPAGPPPPQQGGLNFSNSDLAFSRNQLVIGNFNGFNTYDIENTKRPQLLASAVCPGGQGDVSIHGNLLFMSVEQTRGRVDCGTQGVQLPVSAERFRGVRIFDISDVKNPKQVAAVQTCRGSHTHTLVADPKDPANLYVYGSGTSAVRSAGELADCSGKDPKEDPGTALFSIDVIKVPLAAPERAAIVNRPRIFADEKTGAISGLWPGGNYGQGTQTSRVTNQCHDITVYPAIGLAAGACAGNGILLDISDPVHPVRLDAVGDKNFAYWHSATFNNDGTKVVFTDEWGGGSRPRCRATDPINWGADAIFDIVDRKLVFASDYKRSAPQTEQENCVAHNGSLVPVPGRDIMVQAWYQGGISVFDFTDSHHPVEIAFFDRGPLDAKQLLLGGYWSAYWYNGHIYGSEIARGIDVFALKPSEYLTQNEIQAASQVFFEELNVQEQQKNVWPAMPLVGRAYLDQLMRSNAVQAARAKVVKAALDGAERVRSASDKGAAAVVSQLDTVASQLESDAATAGGRDAMRLNSLAATMRGVGAKLR